MLEMPIDTNGELNPKKHEAPLSSESALEPKDLWLEPAPTPELELAWLVLSPYIAWLPRQKSYIGLLCKMYP